MTHYIDRVEIQLVNQISAKSNELFDAMEEYHHLIHEMSFALPNIKQLRSYIKSLKDHGADKPLIINGMMRKRQNYKNLYGLLHKLANVRKCQLKVEELIAAKQSVESLHLIESTLSKIETELGGVECAKFVFETFL